ncbi:unnamed protein product, partial [Brachionus calyciflorus]
MRRGIGNNLVYDGENGTFDEFEAAFKYDCIIYNWKNAQKIEAIQICFCYEIEKLIDKGLPGLDEENRTRMLRPRLLSETIKNYLELLSDKKWPEIVQIFDKSVDYKEIYQGKFQIKQEVDLNKIEQSRTRSNKFNGTCNFCQKFGHKASECQARMNQSRAPNPSNFQKRLRFQENNEYQLQNHTRPSSSNWRNQNDTNNQPERSYESNRNMFNRQSNQRKEQQGYMIEAEIEVDSDEYQETNLIEFQNIVCSDKSNLPRVESNVEFFGESVKLNFLADSGSIGYFISPKSLAKSLSDKIENFIKTKNQSKGLDLRKTNLTIKSALNSEEAKCTVGKIKFKMNEWEGEHEFIFANISEPAIIGIDFFTKFGANFDFAGQKIVIKDNNQVHKINMINEPVAEIKKVKLENKICASSLYTVKEDGTVLISVLNTSEKVFFIVKEEVDGWVFYAEEFREFRVTDESQDSKREQEIKMD